MEYWSEFMVEVEVYFEQFLGVGRQREEISWALRFDRVVSRGGKGPSIQLGRGVIHGVEYKPRERFSSLAAEEYIWGCWENMVMLLMVDAARWPTY